MSEDLRFNVLKLTALLSNEFDAAVNGLLKASHDRDTKRLMHYYKQMRRSRELLHSVKVYVSGAYESHARLNGLLH